MISAAMIQPELTGRARPGIRFGLIEYALAPVVNDLEATNPELLAQLRLDLALVVSAEALFSLTDLCGLSIEDAIDSAERTARTLTSAAIRQSNQGSGP
jgi:hypothetical protein